MIKYILIKVDSDDFIGSCGKEKSIRVSSEHLLEKETLKNIVNNVI